MAEPGLMASLKVKYFVDGRYGSTTLKPYSLGKPSKTTQRILSVKGGGGTPPFRSAFFSTMIFC